MAYGFQQFDSSGNLIVDSSASTVMLHKLWDSVTITLYPAPNGGTNYGTYYRDYTLTGLTSASDLLNNYIIVRKDTGNLFSIFHNDAADHSITYQSANTVRATYGATCETWSLQTGSVPRQCTTADVQTQTYDIFSIGKTLT